MFYVLVEVMSNSIPKSAEEIKTNLEMQLRRDIPDCIVEVLKLN